jgi:hypothetical protein
MPRLLNSKRFRRAVLLPACVWVIAATGCGVFQRFDEEWAIGAMIQIRKAEEAFKSANGHYGTLEELAASHLSVPSPVQYGYQFTVRTTSESYVAVGVPTRSKEISMSLYLDQSGIIRGRHKKGDEADVKDPPLKGYGDNP